MNWRRGLVRLYLLAWLGWAGVSGYSVYSDVEARYREQKDARNWHRETRGLDWGWPDTPQAEAPAHAVPGLWFRWVLIAGVAPALALRGILWACDGFTPASPRPRD